MKYLHYLIPLCLLFHAYQAAAEPGDLCKAIIPESQAINLAGGNPEVGRNIRDNACNDPVIHAAELQLTQAQSALRTMEGYRDASINSMNQVSLLVGAQQKQLSEWLDNWPAIQTRLMEKETISDIRKEYLAKATVWKMIRHSKTLSKELHANLDPLKETTQDPAVLKMLATPQEDLDRHIGILEIVIVKFGGRS